MDTNASKQIRLILDHESDLAKNAFEQKLKALYADHAAKGLLKSGRTIKISIRTMEELASRLITDSIDQVSAIAKDMEAFTMVSESVHGYLALLGDKVEDIATMAGGHRQVDGRPDSILNAAQKLFSEGRTRLERELEIHRFTFIQPFTPPETAALSKAATEIPAAKNAGGRPPAEFWDDMWASIATSLYGGDLQPKVQADIERAMAELIEGAGHSAADSTIRKRARKLWGRLQGLDS